MKKISLLIMVFLATSLFASESFAQLGFQLGVKGGLNFSDVQTDIDTDGSTGFHAGAYTTFKFSKVAIQPEILWNSLSSEITTGTVVSELKTSYVNIPVLVKFYVVGGLNVQVGPQFGFATVRELEVAANNSTVDLEDELKGSDVSLVFGLGVDLPAGLNVTARYNLGLSDINDSYDFDLDPATDDELKNQVFQISLGYSFIKK